MSKFRTIKNSLIAGEISGSALGRTDISQYPHACKTLRNMIPLLEGGADRRPGTRHAFSYAQPMRLIPFVYSRSEAYAVALATDGEIKVSYKDPTYATALDPTPTILSATVTGTHDYGNYSFSGLAYGAYEHAFEVQYVQSADILYLVHGLYKPKRLKRTSANTFTFEAFDAGLSGNVLMNAYPYRMQNAVTALTLTPSHTSGSGRTLIASSALFDSGHVGALFKINHGGTIGCCKITSVNSPTSAVIDIIVSFGAATAQPAWWESAWSEYRGWPRTISFFQQRLCYGGTRSDPDSVWLSETSDYNQLSVESIVDPRSSPTGVQPFTIEMSSQQLNEIQWLSSEDSLVVGTGGDEFIITREVESAGFGCDNARAPVQTHYGSSYLQPVRIGNELLFATADQKEIRALVFNEAEDSYVADPVQLLFSEYPKTEQRSYFYSSGIRSMAYDGTRKTLWCCDTAGNLFGLTRERRINVAPWHTHVLGGFDATKFRTWADFESPQPIDPAYYLPTGSVVSLCVVPDPIKKQQDLWLCTMRKIGGEWVYHVEYISGLPGREDSIYASYYKSHDVYYLDDFNDYDALSHLEGESVSVVFRGTKGLFSLPGKTVTSGTAVFTETPPTGNEITLGGYPFVSYVEPVGVEAGSVIGTSQGANKRIHLLTMRLYKTAGCKYGKNSSSLMSVNFGGSATQSAELYTGDKTVEFDGDYDRDGLVYIASDGPQPLTFVSVIAEGQTYD